MFKKKKTCLIVFYGKKIFLTIVKIYSHPKKNKKRLDKHKNIFFNLKGIKIKC